MLIDYRKNPSAFPYLSIDGARVERMIEYKYLETVLGNKLNFNSNKNFIHKKCQPRIFCLQRLRSLDVNSFVLLFYYWISINVLVFVLVWSPECEERKCSEQSGECKCKGCWQKNNNRRPWVSCMNVVWYEKLEWFQVRAAMYCFSIITSFHPNVDFGYQKQKQIKVKLYILALLNR